MTRTFRVKRVVFSSSAAIYGDEPTLPKDENSIISPISPYGYEKLIGEHYMKIYNDLYGVETVSLRYFNVYGERQDPSSEYSGVISIFEDKISKGESPFIYGDGGQYRDFIYVKDIVNINFLAMERDEAIGEAFALGTGSTTTIKELFYIIAKKYSQNIEPNYQPARGGDIRESICKNSKTVEKLGFKEFTPFEVGIAKI
jgi:UDP-glucose 4-epimerase